MLRLYVLAQLLIWLVVSPVEGWIPSVRPNVGSTTTCSSQRQRSYSSTQRFVKSTLEETTEKYGLEVGLAESLRKEDGGESAKSLLKRYGIAYLATSIPLALISFILCYLLVDNGVDVAGLLAKVGIENNDAGEKAGTFALAYAAHKAASPIRFPPTVLLTPIVAKLIGKEPNEVVDGNTDDESKKTTK